MHAACVGWKPSQNTYSDALAHVPMEIWLQSIEEVSNKPVPQQAFLPSKNPVINSAYKPDKSK